MFFADNKRIKFTGGGREGRFNHSRRKYKYTPTVVRLNVNDFVNCTSTPRRRAYISIVFLRKKKNAIQVVITGIRGVCGIIVVFVRVYRRRPSPIVSAGLFVVAVFNFNRFPSRIATCTRPRHSRSAFRPVPSAGTPAVQLKPSVRLSKVPVYFQWHVQ